MAKHDGTYMSHATSKRVSKAKRAQAAQRRHRTAQRKLDKALASESAAVAERATGPATGRAVAAPLLAADLSERREERLSGILRRTRLGRHKQDNIGKRLAKEQRCQD